jgi:hypothetical protein
MSVFVGINADDDLAEVDPLVLICHVWKATLFCQRKWWRADRPNRQHSDGGLYMSWFLTGSRGAERFDHRTW